MALFKKRGKWYIDYYYQGRRIRECVGTNKRRAKNALDVRRGEIVQGRFKLQEVKASPLLEEFAKEFLEWAKANCRAWETHHASHLKPVQAYFHGKRLHEITAWLVEKYKAHRLHQETQRPRPPKADGEKGKPWPPQYVKPGKVVASAFRRARTRAVLTDFRFHNLRHTCATRLVRAGADLITVARLLGHQDLRMVQRYAHPGAADARRAVQAVENRARTGHQVDTASKKGLRLMAVTP